MDFVAKSSQRRTLVVLFMYQFNLGEKSLLTKLNVYISKGAKALCNKEVIYNFVNLVIFLIHNLLTDYFLVTLVLT